MAAYRVVLTPAAERQFAKLSHQAREMIAAALLALAGNPRPPECIKLAGAEDVWRIRVRQYRVVYQILDDQLIVTVVKIRARWSSAIPLLRRRGVRRVGWKCADYRHMETARGGANEV